MMSIDPSEFRGRRVVITGGTRGAGAAAFQRFAAGGAALITAARSERPDFVPPKAFLAADLTTPEGVATSVENHMPLLWLSRHCGDAAPQTHAQESCPFVRSERR